MKRVLKIPVSEETYEYLRDEAFHQRVSMASLVRNHLESIQKVFELSLREHSEHPASKGWREEVAKTAHQSKPKTMRDVIKERLG